MGREILVTVGTDGFTDWVKLADGVKANLGAISVLKFVVGLVPRAFTARSALDAFLANGHAMISVDEDKMWAMLKPRRARWAADSPLIPRQYRTFQDCSLRRDLVLRQGDTMADTADSTQAEAIKNQITQVEEQISILSGHASDAGNGSLSKDLMNDQIASLKTLIGVLRNHDGNYGTQKNNSDFQASALDEPSYAIFQANTELAETIVARVAAAHDIVEKLVTAGKKFDSPRAKQDLHRIASSVSEMARDVDLAQPWVRGDLDKLATEADRIHGLFESAKV